MDTKRAYVPDHLLDETQYPDMEQSIAQRANPKHSFRLSALLRERGKMNTKTKHTKASGKAELPEESYNPKDGGMARASAITAKYKASAKQNRAWEEMSKDERAADVQAHYDMARAIQSGASAPETRDPNLTELYGARVVRASKRVSQSTIERTPENKLRFERDMARIAVSVTEDQRDQYKSRLAVCEASADKLEETSVKLHNALLWQEQTQASAEALAEVLREIMSEFAESDQDAKHLNVWQQATTALAAYEKSRAQ